MSGSKQVHFVFHSKKKKKIHAIMIIDIYI